MAFSVSDPTLGLGISTPVLWRYGDARCSLRLGAGAGAVVVIVGVEVEVACENEGGKGGGELRGGGGVC